MRRDCINFLQLELVVLLFLVQLSLPLAKFAGAYVEPLHGEVRITQSGAGLRMQYGSAFVGPLEHWHYDTFRANWEAAWREPELVTFVLDADGKPNAIEAMGARFTRAADAKESRQARVVR